MFYNKNNPTKFKVVAKKIIKTKFKHWCYFNMFKIHNSHLVINLDNDCDNDDDEMITAELDMSTEEGFV